MREALIKYYIAGSPEKDYEYIVVKSVLGHTTSYRADKYGNCINESSRKQHEGVTFEDMINELLKTIIKSSDRACYDVMYMWSI